MKSADCSRDLIDRIKSKSISSLLIDGGGQKVVAVNTIDQVLAQLGSALIKRPAIGVMYEGGRSKDGQQIGLNAELVYSLFVLTEKNVLAPDLSDVATETQIILDATRAAIQGEKSPTGHKWVWVLEAPAAAKGNLLVWVQRWSTGTNQNPR